MSAIADSAGKYKYAENQINCCLTFHFVYYDRGTTILRVNRCVVCDLVNYTLIQAWAIIIYSCHRWNQRKSSRNSHLFFSVSLVSVHKIDLPKLLRCFIAFMKFQFKLNMITQRCGVCSDIYYCDNQAWRRFNYPGAETKDINITICPNIPWVRCHDTALRHSHVSHCYPEN